MPSKCATMVNAPFGYHQTCSMNGMLAFFSQDLHVLGEESSWVNLMFLSAKRPKLDMSG